MAQPLEISFPLIGGLVVKGVPIHPLHPQATNPPLKKTGEYGCVCVLFCSKPPQKKKEKQKTWMDSPGVQGGLASFPHPPIRPPPRPRETGECPIGFRLNETPQKGSPKKHTHTHTHTFYSVYSDCFLWGGEWLEGSATSHTRNGGRQKKKTMLHANPQQFLKAKRLKRNSIEPRPGVLLNPVAQRHVQETLEPLVWTIFSQGSLGCKMYLLRSPGSADTKNNWGEPGGCHPPRRKSDWELAHVLSIS